MPGRITAALENYARMPVASRLERPRGYVSRRFLAMGIKLDFAAASILAGYQEKDYAAFCARLEKLPRPMPFTRIMFDRAEKIKDFDFSALSDDFFTSQTRDFVLNLTNLRIRHSSYLQSRERYSSSTTSGPVPIPEKPAVNIAPTVYIPKASKLLTDDRLFNPRSGVPYPRCARDYHALVASLLDDQGRFPGDDEALTGAGTFAPSVKGVTHLKLKRRGRVFDVEVIAPHLHCSGVRNRLIFDADLIAQGAALDAYGTAGVSYDREAYYVRRLFNADRVPFIRFEGWPVSFAAMQGYETAFQGENLYYAFIHFVMTRGVFQMYGLTSYSVREGMSSLFYADVWHDRPNLMIDAAGNLRDYRLRMWVFAHSGRFTPFYAFVKSFEGVDTSAGPIAETVIADVHRRITPADDLSGRSGPEFKGIVQTNGAAFPIAVDRRVYPEHTRYPVKGDQVNFPQSELNLPSSIREVWLDAIGGEKGVAEGNGIYFGGLVTLGKIRAAKKREEQREGGRLERAGDWLRGRVVSHE